MSLEFQEHWGKILYHANRKNEWWKSGSNFSILLLFHFFIKRQKLLYDFCLKAGHEWDKIATIRVKTRHYDH